jgi:lysophospholipase L1-like esterase
MLKVFMKSFLLFLLIIGACHQCPAQTNSLPVTNASPAAAAAQAKAEISRAHWNDRVRSFREQNLAWRNVVLLGDSITEAFDVTKYFPGRRVLNRGIGADIIGNGLPPEDHRGVLRRLDNSVFDCAATDVFILIGINDLGNNHTPELMEEGYRDILQHLRTNAPSLHIHIQSVLPTSGKYAHLNADVLNFNERLRKMAVEFNCYYINLHDLMTDEKGELKADFTIEGLHLKEPAYVVWRAEILKTMGWN